MGDLVSVFEQPGADARPMFRWWWPGGLADPAEVTREVDQIADAGFGGVEIADVWDSVVTIDPVRYGFGTKAWNAAVEAALRAAKRRGLHVDLTIGPHWPSVVPSENPDDVVFAKELAHGQAVVEGGATFRGPVPEPATPPKPWIKEETLVAVQAMRCAGSCTGEAPVGLRETTLVDLTSSVDEHGKLSFTAPDGGQWVVLGFWQRGTGQRSAMYGPNPDNSPLTDPDAYVVDHFSAAGAEAVVHWWESSLLTPPIRTLLGNVGGAFFEDSLELQSTGRWTPAMLSEFETRRGYSLKPWLAATVMTVAPGFPPRSTPSFRFDGGAAERVRHDYEQTLSDIWLEHRIRRLVGFAHSLGMKYRNQGYGEPVDSILSAATTDIPEGESLGFGDNLDAFRALAAGRDMGGRTLLSDEVGAFFDGAYGTTWRQMLATMNANYAGGVNQMVLHGFAYADAPNARWPGFQPFSPFRGRPGFAEGWGPRQPTWVHVPDVSAYLARTQAVLRRGRAQVDVAVYRQDPNVGRGAPYYADPALARAGYSYGFLSPGVLDLPSATVAGARLAPEGPGYKALLLVEQATLPLTTAQQILGFARAGLPILVVGDAPAATPGFAEAETEDKAVRRTVAELLAEPSVRRVASPARVPAALRAAGVRPAAESLTPSDVLNVHRGENDVDYFYLFNPADQPARVTVSFATSGQPFAIDAWTGRVRPVAVFLEVKGRTEVPIALEPGQTAILAFAPTGRLGVAPAGPHATASVTGDAEILFGDDGRLRLRATAAGAYSVALSSGPAVDATIEDVAAPQTLSSWHLRVEDWQPGETATQTARVLHDVDLETLAPWTAIPGLEDVSGIGRYTTRVTLGEAWTGGRGARLELGSVSDTCRVTINGHELSPVDPMDPVVDAGPYLEEAENLIEVEVATPLLNRLRVSNPEVFGSRPRMEYGLMGPVRLVPYGEVALGPERSR